MLSLIVEASSVVGGGDYRVRCLDLARGRVGGCDARRTHNEWGGGAGVSLFFVVDHGNLLQLLVSASGIVFWVWAKPSLPPNLRVPPPGGDETQGSTASRGGARRFVHGPFQAATGRRERGGGVFAASGCA